jgi:hypothetical protein
LLRPGDSDPADDGGSTVSKHHRPWSRFTDRILSILHALVRE